MASGTQNIEYYHDDIVNSVTKCYRILLASGQYILCTEKNVQRFAVIIVYDSTSSSTCGIYIVDRWGNRHSIHGTNEISFEWTGKVNELGTLKITNVSSGYIGVVVLYPPSVYTISLKE